MKYLVALLLVLPFAAGRLNAAAQSCESSPAVRAALQDLEQRVEDATFERRHVLEDQAYHNMMQLDPLDFRPVLLYLQHIHYSVTDQWAAVRDQAVSDARSHPQDPLKLTAAAFALSGYDTPQAFHFGEQAIASDANYAQAYIELARLYENSGKYADKAKAADYLAKYYRLCPAGLDSYAIFTLKKLGSNELRTEVATNFRQRLSRTNDPHLQRWYSEIWSLEFSALPIAEHPKERQRVAEDLKRLEALPINPTAEWLDVLKDGTRQSGAPEDQVKAMETRILKEFPHSDEAFGIWYHNWNDQHPQPAGEASAAEWQQYMKLALAHYRELPRLFPNQHGFGYYLVEYTAHLDGASNEEIVREGEAYIKEGDLYEGPSSFSRQHVAGVFLDHDIQPARALALVREARRLRDSPREKVFSEPADYAKPKEIQDAAKEHAISNADFYVLYLRACRAAGDTAAAEELKASVEAAPPAIPEALPPYWNARAILAEIDGHTTDALAFYQKALFLRDPPQKQYGVLNDKLLADARRVWTASQGSQAAFAIWSQPDVSAKPVLAEGRWEKPDRELPAFELADLQGKTWKLTRLEGKKVLINIWATWCGPCQSELPHLEKLYEQTKNRPDIAILSLNFDDDVGLVEPFVKKKGYTFPVLPAYTFLANKIDVNSIPRNWLVDANGRWQWEQVGFNSTEPDWEKSMLTRLEGTK